LELALTTPGFFPDILNKLLARMLSFPIPTVAALNGHTFAGGLTLALAHDYRIMKQMSGKGRAMLCMNEIDFGAVIPTGMMGLLIEKASSPAVLRKLCNEGHRFEAEEALRAGLVDALAPSPDETIAMALKLAESVAPKARSGVWGAMKIQMYRTAWALLSSEMSIPRVDELDSRAMRRLTASKL